MRVIINADDFGLSKAVNFGIVDSMLNGVVTSTTMLVNAEGTADAVELIEQHKLKQIGVHLALTMTKPLTDCKNFTLANGFFKSRTQYSEETRFDQDELFNEWLAQINHFIKITGQKPSHIDSHHHIHLYPDCIEVVKSLGEKFNLPIRGVDTEYKHVFLLKDFYDNNIDLGYFKNVLVKYINKEYVEIMVHPGFMDADIENITSYSKKRIYEHQLLTSQEIKDLFIEFNVELIDYNAVVKA